jgi:aryl-alcohol dehydrogenase-like predicted oxidoreductase
MRLKMKLSKLQLGTVQFGLNYGIANKEGKPTYEKARDIVKTAFEGGITCFDTAASYGNSEEILGRAVEELGLKGKITIVTKVLPVKNSVDNSIDAEKYIFKSIETSLKKLRLEKLPICLFHREEDSEYIPFLIKASEQGLIEKAGISIDSEASLDKVLDSGAEYVQAPFNIFDKRMLRSGFIKKANATGIGIFTRSVYLQGLVLMPEKNIIHHLSQVIPVRRKLEKIATANGMSMAELCMRYVLSFNEIQSVLTGVDSNEQLRQNIELASKGPLNKNILEAIDNAVPFFEEKLIRPACWPHEK